MERILRGSTAAQVPPVEAGLNADGSPAHVSEGAQAHAARVAHALASRKGAPRIFSVTLSVQGKEFPEKTLRDCIPSIAGAGGHGVKLDIRLLLGQRPHAGAAYFQKPREAA